MIPGWVLAVALTPQAPPDATIELERTFCLGTCPIFTVTLEGDGTVQWRGRSHVGAIGRRSTPVAPFEVAYLLDRFRELELAPGNTRYGSFDDDGPSEILRLRAGEDRRTVAWDPTWADIPPDPRRRELVALGEAIECVLGLEKWIRVDEPIEPRSEDPASLPFGLPADALHSVRIELETWSDEEPSPMYRIVLRGDGCVEWQGRDHVRERGERTTAIPVEQVRWLLHRFARAGFFDLADPSLGPARTYCPTTLRLRFPGRYHVVTFREPAWPAWGAAARRHPDANYRTAIDCAALAKTIRVLAGADRWIGRGWD